MKTLNPLQLGITFAGCFLGAGYVSGQELYQYFSSFGKIGYLGLLITMMLMFLLGTAIMTVIKKADIREMDKLIVPKDIPQLRILIGIIQSLFIFGITIIVCAGIGALLKQLFNIPAFIGSAVFCFIIAVLAAKGVKSLINVLSATVPVLVTVTAIISCAALLKSNFAAVNLNIQPHSNPLLGNWLISSINYVCYSLFCGIGILTPLSHLAADEKQIIKGVAIGSCILLIIALGILLALAVYPDSVQQELPMLALSSKINSFLGYIYALLLLGGMLGAALSTCIALINYAHHKFKLSKKKQTVSIFILAFVAWLCSLFGFGDLIGIIYPICGYFGFIAMIIIIIRYFKLKTK
jgi:uncharacterized membrane protein YkvI